MARVFTLLLLAGGAWAVCPVENLVPASEYLVFLSSQPTGAGAASTQPCSYYFCGQYSDGYVFVTNDAYLPNNSPPDGQTALSSMMTLEESSGCWSNSGAQVYTVYMFEITIGGAYDLPGVDSESSTSTDVQCTVRTRVDCGSSTCLEGQFASDYVQLSNGFATNGVQCLPCQPGTFNTCLTCEPESEKCTCQWNIPTGQYDAYTPSNIVVVAGQLPVKSCYSCELISPGFNWYFHANDTDHSLRSVVRSDNHYCPGNLYGQSGIPKDCPSNQVHSDDWTRCICPPGFYSTNPTDENVSCTACLIGHFCINNGMTLCPDHQYQDQTQATACLNCANPASASGVPVGTCPTNSLPRQCVGLNPAYHSSPSNCVPCNACQRPYVENIAGQVPCYLT